MTDNKLEDILKELKQYKKEQKQLLKHLAQVEKPIWVQDMEKKKLLRVDEIAFITTFTNPDTNSSGLKFYTMDGKEYMNFDSISNVDEEFSHDERLMKTNRSYIVNLNNIDTVKTDNGRVLTFKGLPSDLTADVSYKYLDEFLLRLGAVNDNSNED